MNWREIWDSGIYKDLTLGFDVKIRDFMFDDIAFGI